MSTKKSSVTDLQPVTYHRLLPCDLEIWVYPQGSVETTALHLTRALIEFSYAVRKNSDKP